MIQPVRVRKYHGTHDEINGFWGTEKNHGNRNVQYDVTSTTMYPRSFFNLPFSGTAQPFVAENQAKFGDYRLFRKLIAARADVNVKTSKVRLSTGRVEKSMENQWKNQWTIENPVISRSGNKR